MNKESFARLPDGAKRAIDGRAGEALSRRLGRANDAATDAGRNKVKALGQIVTGIPEGELPLWKERIQAITDDWTARTPDGARVLAAFRDEIRTIRQSP
jgi:TRAP-type C4-dicarboxylate transport system substrate-binding protein